MYRPSLKSHWSLMLLFAFALILFVIARLSYVTIKADFYEDKVLASKTMSAFMDSLKAEQKRLGISIDPVNDPLQTGLIGAARTTITTDRGLLGEKQAALNPNIAAIFIEEFHKQGLKSGDHIAVGLTGSTPATNLALYAAIKTMKLEPAIITSVSSASYGANMEDFTWLDMERVLKNNGLIDFQSSYASLGGKDDLGIGLPDEGIAAILATVKRNGVSLLAGSTLDENVQNRATAYTQLLPEGQRYKLFVNIGRGLANVGSEPNANQLREGMNPKLAEEQYTPEGIMMVMARENVPVFSLQHIQRWIKKYNLESDNGKLPIPGEGPAFSVKKHNVLIASICLALLALAIIAVIILDRHDRHFMANIVDPDEEL
jgi:poly-gamma-glutamate system protein